MIIDYLINTSKLELVISTRVNIEMKVAIAFSAVVSLPILGGSASHCFPSLVSLKGACTKSAKEGKWDESMWVHLLKDDRRDNSVNGLQLACIRDFSNIKDKESLANATDACGATTIGYGGFSVTKMGLYDHISSMHNRDTGDSNFIS